MSGMTNHFVQAAQIEKLTNKVDALERDLAELKRMVVDSQHGARPLISPKDRADAAIEAIRKRRNEQ